MMGCLPAIATCDRVRSFIFHPPSTMTTATLDDAVADATAESTKTKPVAKFFDKGV